MYLGRVGSKGVCVKRIFKQGFIFMSLFGMTKNHKNYKVVYSKIDIWQDHSYVFSVDNFF